MRRFKFILAAFLMALVLSIILVAPVLADTTPASTTTSLAAEHINGTITVIDTSAAPPTVTVQAANGDEVTVNVVDTTVISREGMGTVTLSEVAVNDRAEITYDGTTLDAIKITDNLPLAKHHAFVGTIKSMDTNSLVVTDKQKGDVTINVNDQTIFKVPGINDATLVNFKAGDKVAILAIDSGNGYLATYINLIPGKPINVQRTGIVQDYTAGQSITLQDKKGDLSTFVITQDTKIELRHGTTSITVGQQATVIARRDPSSDQYTARIIIVFPVHGKSADTNGENTPTNSPTTPPGEGKGPNK